jgi:hypothetical protein
MRRAGRHEEAQSRRKAFLYLTGTLAIVLTGLIEARELFSSPFTILAAGLGSAVLIAGAARVLRAV